MCLRCRGDSRRSVVPSGCSPTRSVTNGPEPACRSGIRAHRDRRSSACRGTHSRPLRTLPPCPARTRPWRRRPGTGPASRNQLVNHQKPVSTTRPVTASTTGPPAPRSQGPAQPARAEQPTSTASQISRRGMSLAPALQLEGPLVQTLVRRGRGDTAQDEEHPGGPGDGAGGGSRGGEQAADVGRGGKTPARLPDNGEVNIAQPQRGPWLLACPVIVAVLHRGYTSLSAMTKDCDSGAPARVVHRTAEVTGT